MTHQINPAPHGERRRRGGGAAAAGGSEGREDGGGQRAEAGGARAAQRRRALPHRGQRRHGQRQGAGAFVAGSGGAPAVGYGGGGKLRAFPRRAASPAGRGGHMAARRVRAAALPRALPPGSAAPGEAVVMAGPGVLAVPAAHAAEGRAGGGSGAAEASARLAAAGARRPGAPGTRGGGVGGVGGGCRLYTPSRDPAALRRDGAGGGGVVVPESSGQGWGLRGVCAAPARPGWRRHHPPGKILPPMALMSVSPLSPFHLQCPQRLLVPRQTRRVPWVRMQLINGIFFLMVSVVDGGALFWPTLGWQEWKFCSKC